MADRIADITALADRAAAEGSNVVSLRALYTALGTPQPHHLTVRGNGYALNHGICPDARCGIQEVVERHPLLSAPDARGRTYQVWLDNDGTLRFREVQT